MTEIMSSQEVSDRLSIHITELYNLLHNVLPERELEKIKEGSDERGYLPTFTSDDLSTLSKARRLVREEAKSMGVYEIVRARLEAEAFNG